MSYTNLPPKATLKPTPFKAHVPDTQIQKFKQLLSLSELGPRTYENTTDDGYFGVTWEFMSNAKKYWEETYNWRKTEDRINSYPNYTVELQGPKDENYTVHFIALYSNKNDAIPITFLHGWPGSFLEFLDLLDVIKNQYPDPNTLPYHIVVPSIPGYGFSSSASPKLNMTMEAQAFVINKLMTGLGFGDGYISQGGDIGSFLSRIMVVEYEACKAVHLNMVATSEPKDVDSSKISEAEMKGLKRNGDFHTTGNAYAREHGTRPSTIGFVLSSSPLALLAWIAEKFLTWTHHDPSLDAILDSVTLYWHTQSFPRSIFPYRQLLKADYNGDPRWHIAAPKMFGYSYFPYDILLAPRAWAEKTGNLVWFGIHEEGGHFAAMEVPKVLWADVEEFVGVWKGKVRSGKL